MSVYDFSGLAAHAGHKIECAIYGNNVNAAVECVDCHEVLLDFDKDELPGHDETCIKRDDKFYFNIQISGQGKTPQEAWESAVESFAADPGDPPDPVIEKGVGQ
jgi:hypothetical protein